MKKLTLSLLLSSSLMINKNENNPEKNLKHYRVTVLPIICSNITAAAGTEETVSIGKSSGNFFSLTSDSGDVNITSNSGNINISTLNNIILSSPAITSSLGDNNLLMIDSSGKIYSSKNISPITCGNLIAGKISGQVISLGNTTGSVNISGNTIKKPTAGSYNTLMIDSNGNISTSSNTTPFICGILTAGNTTVGALNSTSINTTGTITSNSISTGTLTCGNVQAGYTSGQSIALGNATGTINIAATNIKKPASGSVNFLTIDSNGNMGTSTPTSPLTCGILTAGNTTCANITGNTITSKGTLTAGNTTCGNFTAAATNGQSIILGNNNGLINIKSINIQKPTAGNNNILMIDSTGNIVTGSASGGMTFDTITANTINNTGTLNANNAILGGLTAAGTAGQTITLGNSTGTFKISGMGITNPSTGNTSLLMIDSTGQIVSALSTTPISCGNLSAETSTLGAVTASSLSTTGALSAGNSTLGAVTANSLSTTGTLSSGTATVGSLTAGTKAGQNIILGNSTGNFNIKSQNITLPINNDNNFLMINSSGNITTAGNTNTINCNTINAVNSITTQGFLNAGTTTTGSLTSAKISGENIFLGNNIGTITLISKNIINNSGNKILMIDPNGIVSTVSDTNPIQCGNINAKNIYCEDLNAATNPGGTITLGNSSGTINIKSANIINPSSNNYNFLLINNSGNITTSSTNNNIECGNITSENLICNNLSAGLKNGEIVTLGNPTGQINISGTNILRPSINNNNFLMLDSYGNIVTSNNLSPINSSNINTINLTSTGNTNLQNVTTNTLNVTNSVTCGNLTAGNITGSSIQLGNNTGNINFFSSSIITPAINNYNLLIIDSNNKLMTTNTNIPITLGTLNAGTTNVGSFSAATNTGQTISLGNTTGTINITGTTTMGVLNSSTTTTGSLTAGANPGENINLGNNTSGNILFKSPTYCYNNLIITGNINASGNPGTSFTFGLNTGNSIQFNNNSNDINIQSNVLNGNINLKALNNGYISLVGNLINYNNNLTGNTILAIDRTSKLVTSNLANIFKLGNDSAGNNVISIDNATPANGITITSNALSFASGTGSIKISGNGITNPSSGNTSLLMLDSNGKMTTALSTTPINCGNLSAGASTLGAVTASSLSTTGTLSAGNSTLGAVTANSLSTTGTLSSGTTTVGSLTAAETAGQTITLGNSTGAFKISGTGITNPSTGNISLLMIDSTGQITSALSTTPISCGNLSAGTSTLGAVTASSLSTTGTLSAGNSTLAAVTANSLSTTGTLSSGTTTVGSLTAAGTAGQTITLGNSTGAFKISGTGITNPSTGNTSLLMIDSTGQIASALSTSPINCGALSATSLNTTGTLNAGTTVLGSLNAATIGGQTITLGNPEVGGTVTINGLTNINNILNCAGPINASSLSTTGTLSSGTTTVGSLTAAGTAGQTITLGNSTGAFKISGTGITNPSTGNTSLLMIDSTGQIASALSTTPITCGNLSAGASTLGAVTASSLSTTGALSSGITNTGSLTAAGTSGQIVTLGNSTGYIKINGLDITYPSMGNTSLLMINGGGQIATMLPTTPITCGTLSAGTSTLGSLEAGNFPNSNISLGYNYWSSNNIIFTPTGDLNIYSGNNNIILKTASSNKGIIIQGIGIYPAAINTIAAIGINENKIIQSTTSSKFIIGSYNPGFDNFITIDNSNKSNGIELSGIIKINGSNNITTPSSGTLPLYINSGGFLTTISSSKKYKENINPLEFNDNSFDLIQPVSFNYISDPQKYLNFGFIAEDFINIPLLEKTIIYGENNKIESINYQAVFVLLIADYLQTKKQFRTILEEQKNTINNLINICENLQNQINAKENEFNQLTQRCNQLENLIKAIVNKN